MTGMKVPDWTHIIDSDTYVINEPKLKNLENAIFRRSQSGRLLERAFALHKLCGDASKPDVTMLKRRLCTPGEAPYSSKHACSDVEYPFLQDTSIMMLFSKAGTRGFLGIQNAAY